MGKKVLPVNPIPTKTVALAQYTLGHTVASDLQLRGYQCGVPLGQGDIYVIMGGITASPFPFGSPKHNPWWPALRNEQLVNLSETTVLTMALPGMGSSWKELESVQSPQDLPPVSIADLADLVELWLTGIGCSQPVGFIGASMGGLVGIALALRYPRRVSKLVTVSAGLRPDGWGTGCRYLQRDLVQKSLNASMPQQGMSWARQLGMLTYRGRDELNARFGALQPGQDSPPVASYLDHNGKRFAKEFSAFTFLLLSEAIDRCHFVQQVSTPTKESGAGQSSVRNGHQELRCLLEKVTAEVVVVGVPGDLLFPWELQVELHQELRAANVRSSLWRLESQYGHDAFLVDQHKLADILKDSRIFHPSTALESVATKASNNSESTSLLALPTSKEKRQLAPFRTSRSEPLDTVRIGMVGCGVVGTGVLELLHSQKNALAERYGVEFTVTKIAVRDATKQRTDLIKDIVVTCDPLSVTSDPKVDVVVEVAGGVESMLPVIRSALAAGKPVVTANKALLAQELGSLAGLASRTKTSLFCEASAAAALPILRTLNHRSDDVEELLAILNGTSNYILTRMGEDEMSFADALSQAQEIGLAEADPSDDTEGMDAANKLTILAYRSFGLWAPPTSFAIKGIAEMTAADCDLAEAMRFRIRHIASAKRYQGDITLAVQPMLLPDWHLLANVEEEYNAVYLRFRESGDMSLFGKGAGAKPTAAAILSDLIDIAQGNNTEWPAPSCVRTEEQTKMAVASQWYLRVTAEDHPSVDKKIERHLRRLGVSIRSRAERRDPSGLSHWGFVVANKQRPISEDSLADNTLSSGKDTTHLPSDHENSCEVTDIVSSLQELGRVRSVYWLNCLQDIE